MATAAERVERNGVHSSAMAKSQVNLATKVRKPYTITKQRERWTDEEHELFLEALNKHGRTWRRIQEFIGTKTTVQIRSHAQKFFSKQQKEKRPHQTAAKDHEAPAHQPAQSLKLPTQGSDEKPQAQYQSASSHPAPSVKSLSVGMQQQQTAAEVAAAAGMVAAAAALQVIQSAGEEVQAQLQASPPQGFPFFGMSPSLLAALSRPELQLSSQSRLSDGTRSSMLTPAQTSVTNPAARAVTSSGFREPFRSGLAPNEGGDGMQGQAAQGFKYGEGSGDLSESRVSPYAAPHHDKAQHAPKSRDAGHDAKAEQHPSRRTLHHSQSGKGSNSLDQIASQLHSKPAESDGDVTLSENCNTSSAGVHTHSGDRAPSARGVAQSPEGLTPSGEGLTNDSSQACSSVQPAQGGDASAMAQLADAAAAICSQEQALQAQLPPAGGGESWQAMQALAQLSAHASMYTSMYSPAQSTQLQQSMTMWQPYLALAQMQSMLGGVAGGMWGGRGMGSNPEQAIAQQAQQALVLASHTMAADQSSIPLPQSLAIAIGAAATVPQGPQLSTALASGTGTPPPGVNRARSGTVPASPSAWLSANPFDMPLPPSSINPAWLGSQSHVAPPFRATPSSFA